MGSLEMAGRDIGKAYEAEFGSMSYGTLYTTLRRLKEAGFVDSRDDEDEDGRVRFFTLTGNGQRAVAKSRVFFRDLSLVGLRNPTPA